MRKIILCCVAAFMLSSCESLESDKVKEGSSWKLIEKKVSIGGPAEFTPVSESEYIQFLSNSEVIKSNGWCGEGRERTVIYSKDGTILTNCNGSGKLLFTIEKDIMIIRNPACIEACDYKYKKVSGAPAPGN
ncbi:hypothetical protein FK178_08290 [Antarcticibacterium arcticum]|uniref:Lipocalin-like domain-containing protein n=1 Tax=Antarcticibacterium arcticum TaxID=2585771 RepID=A0A5B8YJA6_9FLAO|nr:hypothetical protein [Antarcticibacterium arcticum]QED37721.1 hypothetical protein FK178_08290 [Antarcticibacterium arcticum]